MFYSWPEKSSKGEYLLVTIIIVLGILFLTIDYRNTFGRYIKLEYSKLYEVAVTKIEVNKGFLLNDEYWIWPKDTDDYTFIKENIIVKYLLFQFLDPGRLHFPQLSSCWPHLEQGFPYTPILIIILYKSVYFIKQAFFQ